MGEKFEQAGRRLLLVLNDVLQMRHFGQKFTVKVLVRCDVTSVQALRHHHALLVFKVIVRIVHQCQKHRLDIAGDGWLRLSQHLTKAINQVHQNTMFLIDKSKPGFEMLVPMK